MLNIPTSVKNLFKTDGVHKNFRVHFPNGEMADITNENVVQESVKFTESLCSQSTFKFGLAEASVLEFETVGIANMYGMTIEASVEIDCSSLSAADKATIAAGTWDGTWDAVNEVFAVPYGVFRVESCPRDHQSMAHRKVTAYTFQEYDYQNYPNLPDTSIFPKQIISSEAFLSRMLGTEVYHDNVTVNNLPKSAGYLYDSDGNSHYLSVQLLKEGQVLQSDLARWFTVYSVADAQNVYHWAPSFVKVTGVNYDYEKHFAFGKRVAQAITDAGYDLTYNSKKKKIYDSNESAVLANFPYFFYPCLYYYYEFPNINLTYSSMQGAKKVMPNELVPIVALRNSTKWIGAKNLPSAFKVDETDMYVDAANFVTCVNLSGETDGLEYRVALGGYLPAFTINADFPTNLPTVERYGLSDYGTMLEIGSAGDAGGEYLFQSSGSFTHRSYSYLGAFSYLKMIDGILETSARFIKNKRNGGFEQVRLNNASPISVSPNEYSECWWDEYDISPIGQVEVTYKDGDNEETTSTVHVGGGNSVYNMTDNEMLKKLLNQSYNTIQSTVVNSFAPWADTVGFTPIEFSMQGWPWIEAGDALQITAEDGTVVNSYALRIEMSGIQYLTSTITADGGQIIEEVS